MLQKCKKCGISYPPTDEYWHKSKKYKSGLMKDCKECQNAYHRRYNENRKDINRKRLAEWRLANPDKRRAQYWRSEDARKRNDWAGTLLKAIRSTVKKTARELTITREDIVERYEAQSGRCFYSGMKLNFELKKHSPMYPSVDRVDSTRGYTPDNIVITCWWMNRAKFTYTAEDYISLVEEFRSVTPEALAEARRAGLPSVPRPVAFQEVAADHLDPLEAFPPRQAAEAEVVHLQPQSPTVREACPGDPEDSVVVRHSKVARLRAV